MLRSFLLLSPILALPSTLCADDPAAGGLSVSLDSLSRLYNVQSRSISPENFTGEKGRAGMATNGTGKSASRELGQGWKVSPSVNIKAQEHLHPGRNHRPGQHPQHLDDAHRQLALVGAAHLLG